MLSVGASPRSRAYATKEFSSGFGLPFGSRLILLILVHGFPRECVCHGAVEIRREALSMGHCELLCAECVMSATITLLVELGQPGKHGRGGSNTIAKRLS